MSADEKSITVVRDGLIANVFSNRSRVLTAVSERLKPHFRTSPELVDQAKFSIFARPGSTPPVTTLVDRMQIQGEPDREYAVGYEQHSITIVRPLDEEWLTQHILRIVRSLHRLEVASNGGLILHGAMVEYQGSGVIFLGPKRSGKTTSMLSMLARGANYVANDDVGVMQHDGAWVGLGSSRTVSVRSDTAGLGHLMRHLAMPNEDLTHPFNAQNEGNHYKYCYPSELAASFGVSVLTRAGINLLVFQEFCDADQATALCRLDSKEISRRLDDCLLPSADRYSSYLKPFFGKDSSKLLEPFAAAVPAFSLKQTFRGSDRLCDRLAQLKVSLDNA